MDDRDSILAAVKAALAPLPERTPYPEYDVVHTVSIPFDPQIPLWETFQSRLAAVHGDAADSLEGLRQILRRENVKHGYCDPALPELVEALSSEWKISTTYERAAVDEIDFGITRGVGLIAETGSILIDDRLTSNRLAALAPWVSVVVVPESAQHATVADAIAALGKDPNIIWITGPSKTADVEGILIEGVHGPGVQVCYLQK